MNSTPTLRRSLLYVPGDKETMLTKAAGRGADGLILNLEDAVAPANKELARQAVADALRTLDFGGAEAIVRINPPHTDTGYRDLLAIMPHGPHAILLPKVGAVEEVRSVAWTIERLESLHDLSGGRTKVMCMIESAAGLLHAPEIAACHPRVAALIFGAADLSMEVGCAPVPGEGILLHAASRIILAARAAGIDAVDTPHMKLSDPDGLTRSARMARSLGFDGKSAIHPAHIAAINAAFSPTGEQVAWARQVFELVPDGDEARLGAALLDGQLIEAPHLARAKRILAVADMLGRHPELNSGL
jgi:citrate lyase subunit beta/citryl-CoA lyase